MVEEHIAFLAFIGLVLIWLSGRQPFPEISRRFGITLLLIAMFALVGLNAHNPPSIYQIQILFTGLGGIGVVVGMRHISYTKQDVLIAPFSGFLLCIGTVGLLFEAWHIFSQIEQIGAFILAALIILGQVYLVFRGLLIGKLPIAWSQAGLRQIQRGMIEGPQGAIACFEKAWDVEEEHLSPMAYLALERIHRFLGNDSESMEWSQRLLEHGGEEALDDSWAEVIDKSLSSLSYNSSKGIGTNFEEE